MKGGADDESKTDLNLSDCIDFCEVSPIHAKNELCGSDGFFGKKKLAENLA